MMAPGGAARWPRVRCRGELAAHRMRFCSDACGEAYMHRLASPRDVPLRLA